MSLKVVRSDITKMMTEAIVNTANSKCIVGDGYDKAIYNAAGYNRLLDYRTKNIGDCEEGESFITPGFRLRAKYIIHVVSPLFLGGNEGEETCLRACYKNAFKLVKENNIKSISFPLVAAGSFGYPKADALNIAVEECNEFLKENDCEVYITVYDAEVTGLAKKLFPRLKSYIDKTIEPETPLKRSYFKCPGAVKNCESEPFDYGYEDKCAVQAHASMAMPMSMQDSADFLELEESLELKNRVKRINEGFGEYFMSLVEERDMKSVDIQNRAWITKSVYYCIKNKDDYHPSKRVALQLCIGLKLNIDEARDLLRKAGFAFSDLDVQDVIFKFFIENECYDIFSISDALEKYGEDPIVNF